LPHCGIASQYRVLAGKKSGARLIDHVACAAKRFNPRAGKWRRLGRRFIAGFS